MPRRIVGSANYDLYTSLTATTEKIFLRLFADIIHTVVDAELNGALRATGIESDARQHCNYRLRVRMMLTDDTIIVRATSFVGPDTENDEDDRNDDHDICEFEFERDRGQWRLVQISGVPLPIPDLVNRVEAPAACPPPAVPLGITSPNPSEFISGLRSFITSTSSYIRIVDQCGRREQREPALHIFISYSRMKHFSAPRSSEMNFISPTNNPSRDFDDPAEKTVALAVLKCLQNVVGKRIAINNWAWLKTQRVLSALINMEKSLAGKLNNIGPVEDRIILALTHNLRRSPTRTANLLFNVVELAAADSSTLKLSRKNRATWKSLIVRPLNAICANSSNLEKHENQNYIYITRPESANPRHPKAVKSKHPVLENAVEGHLGRGPSD